MIKELVPPDSGFSKVTSSVNPLKRKYQQLLDSFVPYTALRWIFAFILLSLYMLRVFVVGKIDPRDEDSFIIIIRRIRISLVYINNHNNKNNNKNYNNNKKKKKKKKKNYNNNNNNMRNNKRNRNIN
ncbi:protein rer1 [Anaeramoeba flamelloides]|uniref:Protein rer1 n=1 Tax=Anaeramoeba flamelloides TaxID=1746091 RepID=A0AAV7YP97_9EUKA|nr:protein rer1 [Anaeramoeba flamelloides]